MCSTGMAVVAGGGLIRRPTPKAFIFGRLTTREEGSGVLAAPRRAPAARGGSPGPEAFPPQDAARASSLGRLAQQNRAEPSRFAGPTLSVDSRRTNFAAFSLGQDFVLCKPPD